MGHEIKDVNIQVNGILVTPTDLARLRRTGNLGFLNDNLIQAFLSIICQDREHVLLHDTGFLSRFMRSLDDLRHFTRKKQIVDIFKFTDIILPIHVETKQHWLLYHVAPQNFEIVLTWNLAQSEIVKERR